MQKEWDKKIDKVVVNSGIGRLASQGGFADKVLPELQREFAEITGQKPAPRGAKKSVAGFKIREGMVVGLVATLRGARMRQFLEKIIHIVLPRVRDFRGIPAENIDKNGNLTFGIKEHIVFPEIIAEKTNLNFGIQITIVPKELHTHTDAVALYKTIGIPFKK